MNLQLKFLQKMSITMLLQVIQTLIELGELSELAYADLILSINMNSLGKLAFELVRSAKSLIFSEGHCKIAWDRLINKYALHIASSLLKFKKWVPLE